MKRLISISLAMALFVGLVAVVWATSGNVTVISNTDAKVYYAGYDSLPTDWNTPGFDDSAWESSALYKHVNYLDPTTVAPFAGTGAKWISYRVYETQLPDYNDPSMIGDVTNFATYLFRKDFQVPATAYNVSGTAAVAADNYGWLYLNGAYLVEATASSGYNFRPGEQVVAPITAPSLECNNVLAAGVENGARVSGSGGHGPMGLLFLLDLNYEVPDVMWQPPVTNDAFELKDGTTLPLKFKLYKQDGTLITDVQDVSMKVEGPGGEVANWSLGDGVDNLRFDPYEFYYIANFQTKNFDLEDGGTYTAAVYDGCTGEVLADTISFVLSTSNGTGRGNK